ncbi:hypothetical protein [Cupriavidus basilensis]|uniref:hypothetical protein n=1 Tax=Cupriavidus basilensis TaxID=68895 RepID=UPI001300C662|nr:hypothetical protein [Cupriavidus basilensis]
MTKSNWTYAQFVAANPEKGLTPIDYIHAISKFTKLPDDFYLCMASLLWPSFFEIEG